VLPFIGLAVLLTLPAFRKLSVREKGVKKSGGKEVYTVLLAIGTGLLLTGRVYNRMEGDSLAP